MPDKTSRAHFKKYLKILSQLQKRFKRLIAKNIITLYLKKPKKLFTKKILKFKILAYLKPNLSSIPSEKMAYVLKKKSVESPINPMDQHFLPHKKTCL